METTQKVIAGPADTWYALSNGQLIGFPMSADENESAPTHPDVSGDWAGWGDITDPAPETDVDALIAELA